MAARENVTRRLSEEALRRRVKEPAEAAHVLERNTAEMDQFASLFTATGC